MASSQSEVLDLLVDWEEKRQQGADPTPEQLTTKSSLWDPLKHAIQERKAVLSKLVTPYGPPAPEYADPYMPRVIDRMETVGVLGQGGMGIVYKVWQPDLKRHAALKMILGWPGPGADARKRFQREAETLARLKHPNIVQVHQYGECEDRPYLVLELVEGGNLAQYMGKTPQPPHAAAEFLIKLTCAVQAAHDQGILHRDLKPANILLQCDGELPVAEANQTWPFRLHPHIPLDAFVPKVTDFGLARRLDESSSITCGGMPLGTPSYMAPEQVRPSNRPLTPASDVYALGAILYEMLTGRAPFQGTSPLETMDLVCNTEPVPPHRLQPQVPAALETICLKCLAKDPSQRYASAAELSCDLDRFLAGLPIQARAPGSFRHGLRWLRRRAVAAMLGLGLLMASIAVASLSNQLADQKDKSAKLERRLQSTIEQRRDLEARVRDLEEQMNYNLGLQHRIQEHRAKSDQPPASNSNAADNLFSLIRKSKKVGGLVTDAVNKLAATVADSKQR